MVLATLDPNTALAAGWASRPVAAAQVVGAQAADPLGLARGQTAFSLAFHICFAVFGVGIPWLLLYTEGRWLRTGDETWLALTKKWSRAFAVLFAVGAVSGTVLSFEFGLLWPAFMARYGGALGLSFTLEGFAFFAEAIFLGMYLYGWRRLSPRAHWLTLWPIAIAGTLSTLFIITANAWMNVPTGIVTAADGRVVSAEPLAPLRSPSAPPQVAHMLLAALMCTGGVIAGIYAVGMLRGRRDLYHQRGLRVGLAVVLVCAPLQLVVGDWAARVVSDRQPVKLAAMEGLRTTESHAPLTIGGIYDAHTGRIRYGLEIPSGLSLLEGFDVDHVVTGLDAVPAADRPDAAIVHTAFDVMVGLGTGLIGLSALVGVAMPLRRRRGLPALPTGRPWLLAAAASGPAAVLAMLAGWEVTEGGRQPWIVVGKMRVADAVTTGGGTGWVFAGTLTLYLGLATALVLILRRMATGGPGYETAPASPPPAEPYPPGLAGPDRPGAGQRGPDPLGAAQSGSDGPGADQPAGPATGRGTRR